MRIIKFDAGLKLNTALFVLRKKALKRVVKNEK